MLNFWNNTTVGADGKLLDPMNKELGDMMSRTLTKDPAQLVSSYGKTEQGHIFIQQMTKDAVAKIVNVRTYLEQNPDNHMGEPTWDECELETIVRFLGRRYKVKVGTKNSMLRDYRMNVALESAVSWGIGERNPDLDAYKLRLVVRFARPNMKVGTSGGYYHKPIQPFETSVVFEGPGASAGRDAATGTDADFDEWEREMLKTGSPLYQAFVEVMQKVGKISPCKYCRSGVAYDSYVCEECACQWSWTGCACCGEFLGKMTENGVHEMCE